MKKVYIDKVDFICHETLTDNRFEHNAEYIDESENDVELFRYVPEGYSYTRFSDGMIFDGLMVSKISK